ncbi:MAG: nucleoside hydrolase-like domain-containing protein [Planctomycetaceae bacterium]
MCHEYPDAGALQNSLSVEQVEPRMWDGLRNRAPLFAGLIVASTVVSASRADEHRGPLRLIVETDAGGDPDDEQSLVRFLLYANEWDVEAIIANRLHAREGENRNPERSGLAIVRRHLSAYGECWSSLVRHDPRYPTKDALWERTIAGYDDSDEAVRRIIAIADRHDPRPVWYSDWGSDRGAATNNLKRALDLVLKERGPQGYSHFKSRLKLSSADSFGEHTWNVAPPFPLWVDTFRPELDGRRWYHRFSALTATAGGFDLLRDVVTGHGPLGALYPANTTHPQKEGDSLTFLYLVPTGMNDPDHPDWGSWAGRYGRQPDAGPANYFWAGQFDSWNGTTSRDNTLARFAVALQNDFRARLDWCVKPRDAANHPPVVRLGNRREIRVRPGAEIVLDASSTSDPDGHQLTFQWWVYREPGSIVAVPAIVDRDAAVARFIAPQHPGELHIVVTVTDSGEPPLERYGRHVIIVSPDDE